MRRGRGNGDDDRRFVANIFAGNLRGSAGVALRALELPGDVLAFDKTFFLELFADAVAHGVQRRVFDNGGDGDQLRFGQRRAADAESDRYGGQFAVKTLAVHHRECSCSKMLTGWWQNPFFTTSQNTRMEIFDSFLRFWDFGAENERLAALLRLRVQFHFRCFGRFCA